LYLAQEGASVVVNDLGGPVVGGAGSSPDPAQQVVDDIRTSGGQAVANFDDVGDWNNCGRMVKQAVGEFGDLHIVVNNAGIIRSVPIIEHDQQMWEEVVRVHLTGHAGLIHAAGGYWHDQPRLNRSVINSGSRVGMLPESSGQASYAAANAGILMLTLVAANELADFGVRCNAISPTAITRLAGQHPAMQALQTNMSQEYLTPYDPANVAPFVAYLATAECPIAGKVFYVGGNTIQVYKGWSAGAELTSPTRWDVARLAAQIPELVAR
jgi:NAD(P)-dependent dehydrogenase (short-subunit alcohol dehydrogenase family)